MDKLIEIFTGKMSTEHPKLIDRVPFKHFETIFKGNNFCPFSVTQKFTEDEFD